MIGTTQAFALACGFLFVTLYAGNLSGVDGLLFGSFLGITSAQIVVLAIGAAVSLVALAIVGRPLLFASIDPEVAAGRGVPVAALSVAFLVLLGVAAAETSQITGSLLVFALLVLPAATAQTISARPGLSLALSVAIALAVTWARPGRCPTTRPTRSGSGSRRSRSPPISSPSSRPSSPSRRHGPGPGCRPDDRALDPCRARGRAGAPAGPPVLPARVPGRDGGGGLLGAGRLLHGAPQPGVHRRRLVARRLHGRARQRSRSASTCGSACSSPPSRWRSGSGCSARAAAPTTWSSAACSRGCSASGCCSSRSSRPSTRRGTARPARACCSGRSSGSTRARPWWPSSSRWG